jgi:hypothetical protein
LNNIAFILVLVVIHKFFKFRELRVLEFNDCHGELIIQVQFVIGRFLAASEELITAVTASS